MKLPCQITIWYLIPAITAEIVRDLKKLGMKQADIARTLRITPASVSQYISGRRGKSINLSADMQKQIRKLSKRIMSEAVTEEQFAREMCELCISARRKGLLCEHHKNMANRDYDCGLCFGGLHEKNIHG